MPSTTPQYFNTEKGSYSFSLTNDPNNYETPKTDQPYIELERIESKKQGSGFGSEVFGSLINASIKADCPGKIILKAIHSSHLFYYFMGIIPHDTQINYLKYRFGEGKTYRSILSAIDNLKNAGPDIEKIQQMDEDELDWLKDFISEDKKIPSKEIPNSLIAENYNLLLEYRDLTTFQKHIMVLLETLENHIKGNSGQKYPQTYHFNPLWMKMSVEGEKRWLDAVQNNIPFVPFKRFEHLEPFMSETQKNKLHNLLQQMEELSLEKPEAKKSNSNQTSSSLWSNSHGRANTVPFYSSSDKYSPALFSAPSMLQANQQHVPYQQLNC